MTKIRLYSATSIDGFIADGNGDTEWLERFRPSIFDKSGFLEDVGAVVMGRRTFELVTTFGEWPYENKHSFVLTSATMRDLPSKTVYARNGIAAAIQAAREADHKRHLDCRRSNNNAICIGSPTRRPNRDLCRASACRQRYFAFKQLGGKRTLVF